MRANPPLPRRRHICEGCTAAEILDVSRCGGLTSLGFAHMSMLGALRCLDASGTRFNDHGAELMLGSGEGDSSPLHTLERLLLRDLTDRLTDAGLEFIARCAALRTIAINGSTDVSDVGIKTLTRECRALFAIDLSGTSVGSAGLKSLAKRCRRIREALFDGCQFVGNSGASALASLRNLQVLSLRDCRRVGDAFCSALVADPDWSPLTSLDLANTSLTVKGVEVLFSASRGAMRMLQLLDVSAAAGITPSSFVELGESLWKESLCWCAKPTSRFAPARECPRIVCFQRNVAPH